MLKLAYTLATIFKRDEKNKLSFFGGGDGKKIETQSHETIWPK